MPALSFRSAEELEKQRVYKLLPEEEYILEIKEVTVLTGRSSQWDTVPHDELQVRFNVVSFKDGEPAYYEDGTEPENGEPITLVDWINHNKQGLFPRVAKARQFLAAALGIPVEANIELDSFEDLVGKRLIGNVTHKTNQKGNTNDRIDGYRALKSRPPRRTPGAAAAARPEPKSDEEVEADAAMVLARGRELFADDTDDVPF